MTVVDMNVPGNKDRVTAIVLKGHVSLLESGLKNSKMSGTKILKAVTNLTGKTYKRGQYAAAKADLVEYLK